MAKQEYDITVGVDRALEIIDDAVLGGSISASFEDGSDFFAGGVRCAVRVYERYSAFGGNRVSLNITVLGDDGSCCVSAISSGGSQAMFLKINTLGEEAFLDTLDGVLRQYER